MSKRERQTTVLKDKSHSPSGGLRNLFARFKSQEAANALMVVPPESSVAPKPATPKDFIEKQKLGSVTRVTPLSDQVTLTRVPREVTQVNEGTGFTATDLSRVTRTDHRKKQKEKESSSAGWLLLIPAVGLATFALLDGGGSPTRSGAAVQNAVPAYQNPQIRERVEFHRKLTGWKLNRERVDVDLKNQLSAPMIPFDASRVKSPDMMKGLPLSGEAHHRKSSRDRTEPLNPGYADARIMYGLQEEQDAIEWQKRAEELYIQEFIENARRGGYDVEIMPDGRVKAVPIERLPGSENPQEYEFADGGTY